MALRRNVLQEDDILCELYATLKENAEALVAATREIGLEVLIKLRTWSCLEI